MSIGDNLGALLDEAFASQEYDKARIEASKSKSSADELQMVNQSQNALPMSRPPALKMLSNDRLSRKEAEDHLRKLQRMLWDAQRRQFAGEMMITLALQAQRQLDAVQEALMARYVGVDRAESMKPVMARITVKLFLLAEAAVMTFVESYPKAAGEEF